MAAEQARCPNCGALVVEGADWCGQCYTPLKTPAAAPDPDGQDLAGGPSVPHAPGPSSATTDPETNPDLPAVQESALPVALGDEPTWKCPSCGHRNPLDLELCALCGTAFARLFQEEETHAQVDPDRAARMSVIPGMGHWVCGLRGEAILRMLFVFWGLIVGYLTLRSHAAKLHPVAVLYLLSAVVVYVESFVDARRAAAGHEQLLPVKILLYWFAALIFAFMLSIFAAFLGATKHGLTPRGGSPPPG